MHQRRTNKPSDGYGAGLPRQVEGVAEAVEVETVAARLMKRLQLGIVDQAFVAAEIPGRSDYLCCPILLSSLVSYSPRLGSKITLNDSGGSHCAIHTTPVSA
jgi:hypothetical protein